MNRHFTPPRSASGDLSSLFIEAAVRESYRPQDLLERWVRRFPDATPDEQIVAVTDALELNALGLPIADARGEDALGLPNEVRFQMLAGMGAQEALLAVKAIPLNERTRVENDFERLLKERNAPFDSHSRGQITSMMAANHWAQAAGVKSLLTQDELAQTLRKLDFLQNLGGEDLNRFVGRATELQKLHTLWHKQDQHRTTIHVEGPGGMGKSLLVCRFIGDLLSPHHEGRVPDAVFHIDFDRQAFHQARPITIIQEFVVQSRYWLGNSQDEAYSELLEGVRVAASDIEFGTAHVNVADSGRARYFANHLVTQFRQSGRPTRFIIFVDSYEQVLGFDDTAADSCARAAELMEAAGAAVMIIYASRTFADRNEVQASVYINLSGLNSLEADQYLKSRIEALGLSVSNTILRQVRRAVGNTPLALRLAASLIEHAPSERAVRTWATTAETSPALVQAALYERLLMRIRNEQLRKIAMPGLLVRRITPDVIEQVLAEPCDLLLSNTTPDVLMAAARQEGQLFFEKKGDPGALWHRQDVRATMLANLERITSHTTYIAINERAIAFYETQSGALARTEELYHRLRLNQPEMILMKRWLAQAEPELRRVREEFPAEAQAFLRVVSGSAIRESLQYGARSAGPDRDASVERSLQELRVLASKQLQSDTDVRGLLLQLEQAGVDINGELGDLYAQGLFATGRHSQLLTGARSILHKRPGSKTAIRCTIYITAAQLLEGRREWPEAHQFWIAARSTSRKADELTELRCVIGVLRITRKLRINRSADNRKLVNTAFELLSRNGKAIYDRPILSREVCAELLGQGSKSHGTAKAYDDEHVRKLMARMLSRGEAFPSTVDHGYRLDRINEILNLPRSASTRELRNSSAKLFADNASTIAFMDALRDEIDWNLAKSLDIATK